MPSASEHPMHLKAALTALLLAAALATAPAATAAVVVDQHGHVAPRPWQRWIDESRIPIPPWVLRLNFADCPAYNDEDVWGCASPTGDEIWVSPRTDRGMMRHLFFHEVGHWFDVRALNDHDRDVFRRIAGVGALRQAYGLRGNGSWFAPAPRRNVSSVMLAPSEVFADAFDACAGYNRADGVLPIYWWPYWWPSQRRHRHVCEWLRVIARRYQSQPV